MSKERRYAVLESDGRDGPIFGAQEVDETDDIGDVLRNGTIIGMFRSLVEAETWAERKNCE